MNKTSQKITADLLPGQKQLKLFIEVVSDIRGYNVRPLPDSDSDDQHYNTMILLQNTLVSQSEEAAELSLLN